MCLGYVGCAGRCWRPLPRELASGYAFREPGRCWVSTSGFRIAFRIASATHATAQRAMVRTAGWRAIRRAVAVEEIAIVSFEEGVVAANGSAATTPCISVTAYCAVDLNRRRRRLLLTTKTELNAIAAPASIGLSRPAMASGIAATL